MPYRFADHAGYPYKPGSVFLGLDTKTADEVGLQTERNLITIAGAGTGKGAALIIQNLLRWPYAALVIDPKGENAEETWQAREAIGQRVGVIDPFRVAKVPDRLRVSINPLAISGVGDALPVNAPPTRDDILAIADGIVKRSDPEAAQWDDGARTILAGIIAFVCHIAPPHARTLAEARRVLMTPAGGRGTPAKLDRNGLEIEPAKPATGLYADAEDMTGIGGLARAAGVSILSALDKGKGADSEYLSGARRHSEWLDSPEIEAVMGASSFPLKSLAAGKATLFLVLPYSKMDLYAAFFRLLVRTAQNTIAEAGNKRGPDQKCLFILDEFFTLGRMDEIQKAAGNMRSYGLQLWPFLQDFGQLKQLYGEAGCETFFGNADAQIYFGNTDTMTLSRVSDQLEKLKPDEIEKAPPPTVPHEARAFRPWRDSRWFEGERAARERFEAEQKTAQEKTQAGNTDAKGKYDQRMKVAGTARLTPSEVATLVGKGNDDQVARSAIVFAKMGEVLNVQLLPYYVATNGWPIARQIEGERQLEILHKYLNDDLVENYRKVGERTLEELSVQFFDLPENKNDRARIVLYYGILIAIIAVGFIAGRRDPFDIVLALFLSYLLFWMANFTIGFGITKYRIWKWELDRKVWQADGKK